MSFLNCFPFDDFTYFVKKTTFLEGGGYGKNEKLLLYSCNMF